MKPPTEVIIKEAPLVRVQGALLLMVAASDYFRQHGVMPEWAQQGCGIEPGSL